MTLCIGAPCKTFHCTPTAVVVDSVARRRRAVLTLHRKTKTPTGRGRTTDVIPAVSYARTVQYLDSDSGTTTSTIRIPDSLRRNSAGGFFFNKKEKRASASNREAVGVEIFLWFCLRQRINTVDLVVVLVLRGFGEGRPRPAVSFWL